MNRAEEQRSHQPKCGMCTSCAKWQQDCSGLAFETMPVILTTPSGVKIVRCTEHVRSNALGKPTPHRGEASPGAEGSAAADPEKGD